MIYLPAFQMDVLRVCYFNRFSLQCIQVAILLMLTGLAVSRILMGMYRSAVHACLDALLRNACCVGISRKEGQTSVAAAGLTKRYS
mmetsp:Transcript_25347/g.75684  ORF Transcript_25347/g.75684 Transcript_25347/m.75684 type:complete len:86 (-) Transcript_25347:24-281(-)